MSEQMVRKVVCDHLCGQELVDPLVHEEDAHVILPDGWYGLKINPAGDEYHFCSLECLAQWAASKVGKTLMNWHLEPGALAGAAAGAANPAIQIGGVHPLNPNLHLRG